MELLRPHIVSATALALPAFLCTNLHCSVPIASSVEKPQPDQDLDRHTTSAVREVPLTLSGHSRANSRSTYNLDGGDFLLDRVGGANSVSRKPGGKQQERRRE